MTISPFGMEYDEVSAWFEEIGEPKFRAEQFCRWIWKRRMLDIGEMSDLSAGLRKKLSGDVDLSLPVLIREQRSNIDGTRKLLWRMRDGEDIETALIKQGQRFTACLSTQVGCMGGCPFCATGQSGFVRNLTASEIASQLIANEINIGREIDNIVFMGMGEPLFNTLSLFKAIRMLNHPKTREMGIRRIAVSTAGVVPGIAELAASGLGVRLAVSLHAANDRLRDRLVPINRQWPLAELTEALKDYQRATGDRITVEYSLFKGVNDSVEDARELTRLLRGIHVFINLIEASDNEGGYERSGAEEVFRFKSVLSTAGFETEIRASRGGDISAACGQLRSGRADGGTGRAEKQDRIPTAAKEKNLKEKATGSPARIRAERDGTGSDRRSGRGHEDSRRGSYTPEPGRKQQAGPNSGFKGGRKRNNADGGEFTVRAERGRGEERRGADAGVRRSGKYSPAKDEAGKYEKSEGGRKRPDVRGNRGNDESFSGNRRLRGDGTGTSGSRRDRGKGSAGGGRGNTGRSR